MIKLMKIILVILLFAVSLAAQQPDRWHGLVLDETTIDQAKAQFGEPSKPGLVIKTMLKAARKHNINVEGFNWDEKEGFKDVSLFFLDGTLAWIYLERPKNPLSTVAFVDAYPDLEFYVVTNGSLLGLSRMTSNSFEAITPKGKIIGLTSGGTTYRELGLSGRESKYKPEGRIFSITFESNRWAKGNPRAVEILK